MTRIGVRPAAAPDLLGDGVRPVNLRSDLRPLADLIELVFADAMDDYGRSAVREMRFLSHLGYGLKLIATMNELALGLSLGFVYVMDGQLVGNVSVYPANYPRDLGETCILANVGVHPDYQRRGIGRELMDAGLAMIRQRGASRIILQVNCDNIPAQRLYDRHGFIFERAWRVWRRTGFFSPPVSGKREFHITRARPGEWPAEYALARAARPNSLGGLGWLKPAHKSAFYAAPWSRLLNLLSLKSVERLVIRDDGGERILASCWLEREAGFGAIRARLYAAPDLDPQPYAEALLGNVLSRYDRASIVVEHPRDDGAMNDLLKFHQFKIRRELWHMRLDL